MLNSSNKGLKTRILQISGRVTPTSSLVSQYTTITENRVGGYRDGIQGCWNIVARLEGRAVGYISQLLEY